MTDEKNQVDHNDDQAEVEEEARPLQPVRVVGAGTKAAKFQTGRLKWKDGEPQPELIEGEDEDE